MIRHMFAGGNTPNGFFSYFDNILPIIESKRTIYMKGGSGTGKSTFMKRVGAYFEEKEYDVEYFHCSNDPESIDGVCIPKLKTAIIDATAPHMQDPLIPMAADEIMNAAQCLDSEGLKPHAKELIDILSDKKELIKMAYGYLHAAYAVYMNSVSIYERFLNKPELNKLIYDTVNKIFTDKKPADKEGKHRKLFASAITPNGFVNYMDSLFNHENFIILNGTEGTGGNLLLERVKEEASIRGYDTEGYYSPLSPKSLEHLIIPKLNYCIVTKNSYHDIKTENADEINLYELCSQSKVSAYQEKMLYNKAKFDELAHMAMKNLKESSKLHNRVEGIYIANMDFKKLDEMYDGLINEIF